MKRIILILTSVLVSASAYARVVSPADAETFAKRTLKAHTLDMVYQGRQPVTRSSGVAAPCYYVYNNPRGGWAIISAEDVTIPVLAWSSEGRFSTEGMPENLRGWLERMTDEISGIRAEGVKQTEDIAAMWDHLALTEVYSNSVVLETAKWSQGQSNSPDSYNKYCPSFGTDKLSCTGCTATSTAIVMRYHRWPEKGRGVIPGYVSNYNGYKATLIDVDIDGLTYNWDAMALKQDYWHVADEVAKLIYHCGLMIRVGYSPSATGGNVYDGLPAFAEHMSYSAAASHEFRSTYGTNRWFGMMKAEIDAKRPVLYSGSSGSGGHAFVLDGYAESGMVHINWGWGGSNDGWFALSYLSPDDDGKAYSTGDAAIIGFQPDKSGSGTPYVPGLTFRGRGIYPYYTNTTIEKGKTFYMSADYYVNFCEQSGFVSQVAFWLYNREGNPLEMISDPIDLNIEQAENGAYGYKKTGVKCEINNDIHLGDNIRFCYYNTPAEKWIPIGSDNYNATPLVAYGVYDCTFISVPSNLKASSMFYPDLILGHQAATSVVWSVDGKQAAGNAFSLSAGNHILKAEIVYADGSQETVLRHLTVSK